LDVVSEKVPDLLKELSGVLYSPEQAKKFGLAGAIFYKELKAAGMTDDQAYTLTQQYMSTMSLGSTIKDIKAAFTEAMIGTKTKKRKAPHNNAGYFSSNRIYKLI
jgi:hypothetical protein